MTRGFWLVGGWMGLVACGGARGGAPPESAGDPVPAPTDAAAPWPDERAPSASPLDRFEEDRARIREVVPGWDQGVGVALRILDEDTGERASLSFVDPQAPEAVPDLGLWVTQAQATVDDETIAWLLVATRALEPGARAGDATSDEVVLSLLIEPVWDGDHPEASWSSNPGGEARLTLRPGLADGDLEGELSGRLIANDGRSYVLVEDGYLYINR